jgi:hypothetical protein
MFAAFLLLFLSDPKMRHEYKYLVPESHLDSIRREIAPFVSADPFAVSAEADPYHDYTVRSIYFDDPAWQCYYEKEAGIRDRKKLRIRGYDEGGPEDVVFFEIKRKHNMLISKTRGPARYGDVDEILSTRSSGLFLEEPYLPGSRHEGEKFLYNMCRNSMRPVVLVTYDREPFMCRFDSTLRVTFDKKLRSIPFPTVGDLYTNEGLVESLPGSFILEIKFFPGRGFPSWVRSLLARYELRKQALSKYTMSLDTHDVAGKGTPLVGRRDYRSSAISV